jgi:DNA-binding transcriptional ArsR family regulator
MPARRNSVRKAQQLAPKFAALGHAARLEIVQRLITASPGGLVVGDLQEALGMPGSTLSHHLEALRQEGLVTSRREGRFLRYRAEGEMLTALLEFLYSECCKTGCRVELVPLGAPRAAAER